MKYALHFLLALTCLGVNGTLAESLLLKGAKVITASAAGTYERADILIEAGRITALGEALTAPPGARVIDATGKVIAPGFFNANTQLGVEEIGAIDTTVDFATKNNRITASLQVADAINPDSTVIPYNRMLGLTHALVQPGSGTGLFAGVAAVINLSQRQGTVDKRNAAMVVYLGESGQALAGGSRAAAMAMLREAIEDTRDYARHREDFARGARRAYSLSRHDLEALLPVVEGKMPLIVHISRAADISRIQAFARQQGLKLILAGAEEGWRVAGQIAAQQVPVIIDPIDNLPIAYETLGARLDNAKLLHSAGVTLLFTGMGWQNTHNAFLVRQSAGNAVANGLPYEAAIRAISANPARVFGIEGYGELKTGASASLVVWSGDPLEVTSSVEQVLINGEDMPLISRSTRLRDRYYQRLKEQQK